MSDKAPRTDLAVIRGCPTGDDVWDLLSHLDEHRHVLGCFLSPNDPCSYDHNGRCQAHRLGQRPCEHEMAKRLLGWDGEVPPGYKETP